MKSLHDLSRQTIRYGIVGLASNIMLYVLYLILVDLGGDSKFVVALLYVVGLSVTFIFNKRWSFSHQGRLECSLKRYLILYGCLYLTNVMVLWLFVDLFVLPHAIVQACVVLTFIPVVFLVQRYWVFPVAASAGLE
ncbi:GtrA family protein [Thiocapsa marina]